MLLVRLVESSMNGNQSKDDQSGNRVICFGEHSSWTFTIQERRSPAVASPDGSHESVHGNEQIAAGGTVATPVHNTHYSIPDTMDERTHDLPDSSPDLSNEEMALLRKKGALELPPKEVQDALLDSYFRWVHPAYVIFDRREHMQRMAEGRASLLLLQAIFFIGAIYVEEGVIRKHYANRHAAELMFFKRAKALYEAEHDNYPGPFLNQFLVGLTNRTKGHRALVRSCNISSPSERHAQVVSECPNASWFSPFVKIQAVNLT